ncbi:hypothetical protein IWQ51_002413 [Labrenzia sp. EL_142]|nr:hypothetical protein [Labrenzia sp. EL_142]
MEYTLSSDTRRIEVFVFYRKRDDYRISILFMGNDASHDALSFFCDAAMVEGITPPEAERERLKPTFDRVSETHTNSCTVADK